MLLWFVVCRVLLAVRCLWFVAFDCLVFAVCCMLYADCCMLFDVRVLCLLFAI